MAEGDADPAPQIARTPYGAVRWHQAHPPCFCGVHHDLWEADDFNDALEDKLAVAGLHPGDRIRKQDREMARIGGSSIRRVVATADTHGIDPLPDIPPCNLLIVAGDVEDAHLHPHDTSSQRRYLQTVFASWLAAAPARHIVGIAGNHDFTAIRDPDALRSLPWTYLQDETVEIDGLVIHGSPWTPPFMDWAFMLPEEQLKEKWDLVPEECAVLVTHGPPHRIGDGIDPRSPFFDRTRDPHPGSKTLRARIEHLPALRMHVFGHIHEGYGQGVLERDGLPPLICVNASRVDGAYQPVNAPVVIDL